MKKKGFFNSLDKCYVIAEIGVNHNGDINLAERIIYEAKSAGADAVKFQSFYADQLASKDTPKVDYQVSNSDPNESHYEMLKKLELDKASHYRLFAYCKSLNIDFISTPYDIESAKFLNELGVLLFKTASADLIDLPLHSYIASTCKPVLIATGMANLEEIEDTVNLYENSTNELLLLHCVSNYPASDISLNLKALNLLSSVFKLPIGYSDHSAGSLASCLAVALGSQVIEKHFTLDKNLPGPDHKASSTPLEFSLLVKAIRKTELMLGAEQKKMQPEEIQMAIISRKSLVAAVDISSGQKIQPHNLMLMRPGDGIPAKFLSSLVGRVALRDIAKHEKISWKDFN